MTTKTAALDGFQDIQTLAIEKALATKVAAAAREGIEPGTYPVDFTAHIVGTVTVGADYETRLVNKAKPWNLVAALLTEVNRLKAGAGEAGLDIAKLVAMAEAMDPTLVKAAQEQAETEAAGIKAATLSTAKGKVTTKLAVTPA